nr:reverse transcriptase domain-containing protein [Tanacetum cinerariifolium]
MPPERNSTYATSTSDTPAMNQAAIRNPKPREAPVGRKCSYKEFISCQPFNFKGPEGIVGLIRWFECTESMFSRSNCTEDCKVKFSTGTLTEKSLSWWNSFAQPIRIEESYKITCVEFKKLLIKKYYPRTEIQKMEVEFYHLIVKGNNLKTYYHAKIICDEKVVHIPIDDETLVIQGDRTQVMEQKSEDKRLEDIPVVREFQDVFPEDLPGLPP